MLKTVARATKPYSNKPKSFSKPRPNMEQALSGIIDYLQTQNTESSLTLLNPCSSPKKMERARRDLNPGPPDFHAVLFA
jgi:hypothetical protein